MLQVIPGVRTALSEFPRQFASNPPKGQRGCQVLNNMCIIIGFMLHAMYTTDINEIKPDYILTTQSSKGLSLMVGMSALCCAQMLRSSSS